MGARWEVVKVVGTEEEAALIRGFLESEGVACQVESRLFRQEPVTFGQLGEVLICVPAEDLQRARKMLESDVDAQPASPSFHSTTPSAEPADEADPTLQDEDT